MSRKRASPSKLDDSSKVIPSDLESNRLNFGQPSWRGAKAERRSPEISRLAVGVAYRRESKGAESTTESVVLISVGLPAGHVTWT